MDSCPIVVKVRKNNLKTSFANRFNKTKRAKGDPDIRVGILVRFPQPFTREVHYFCGCRNHIVADDEKKLPLWEVSHPANISEFPPAIPILHNTIKAFSLRTKTIGGDAIYAR